MILATFYILANQFAYETLAQNIIIVNCQLYWCQHEIKIKM
jgi:hypothetical protein